eukprot:1143912-Pelagomonas_calceolata.AAC.4
MHWGVRGTQGATPVRSRRFVWADAGNNSACIIHLSLPSQFYLECAAPACTGRASNTSKYLVIAMHLALAAKGNNAGIQGQKGHIWLRNSRTERAQFGSPSSSPGDGPMHLADPSTII